MSAEGASSLCATSVLPREHPPLRKLGTSTSWYNSLGPGPRVHQHLHRGMNKVALVAGIEAGVDPQHRFPLPMAASAGCAVVRS